MICIGEVLADDLGHGCDSQVCDAGLQLCDGGLLLGLDGLAGLRDDLIGLCLGLCRGGSAVCLGELLCLCDDRSGLVACGGELLLVLGKGALALDAVALCGLQALADGVLSLGEHALKDRPAELGEDSPQDDEGDQHRDELIHLRQDGGDAALLLCECQRGHCSECAESTGYGECSLLDLSVQDAFLLSFNLASSVR